MKANPLREVGNPAGLGTGLRDMGTTPHSSGNTCGVILSNMSKQKLNLTSGSFITAAYPAWLAR
jgi:hypothetical protein